MTSRVVLVTGVSGFIGRHVAAGLRASGHTIVGLDRLDDETARAELSRYTALHLPDPRFADFVKETAPDVVVHCAGRASVPHSLIDPADDFTTNTAMTFALLETLREVAPDVHFIFPSSAAVYGDPVSLPIDEQAEPMPISPYGFHKLQAEQACLEYATVHGMHMTVLRIFSAYGAGLRRQVVWDICRKALSEPIIELEGTGKESRDFIHVRDIASAITLLATHNAGGNGYSLVNLGTGVETSIAALADQVMSSLGLEIPVRFTQRATPGKPARWRADISRLQSMGFDPEVDFATGLAEVARWATAEILDC